MTGRKECSWQAVGDGRCQFGDSPGRQTTSGAAKPDPSPLNQNRSGLCFCHFGKSLDTKPNWDGPNPNGRDAKPDLGGGRIRPRRHIWYLYFKGCACHQKSL
ncbi:hypothetical protein N7505_009830, partial [Penicillium chrysogenum]